MRKLKPYSALVLCLFFMLLAYHVRNYAIEASVTSPLVVFFANYGDIFFLALSIGVLALTRW